MIKVAARSSPLSQAQLREALLEIQTHHPFLDFDPLFVKTQGDRDLKTSLRTLEKTDFFTKEIDDLLLQGQCRLGIHSAKDLPEPLPKGLRLIALTKGVDSSDVLVLRQHETLQSLPQGAFIGTSSERRELAVKKLRGDLQFKDLRGTIQQRLLQLDTGEADGIVVAEAALIRLNLTHLNRIKLPGETTPLQGQLALIARDNDDELRELFSAIDSRR